MGASKLCKAFGSSPEVVAVLLLAGLEVFLSPRPRVRGLVARAATEGGKHERALSEFRSDSLCFLIFTFQWNSYLILFL